MALAIKCGIYALEHGNSIRQNDLNFTNYENNSKKLLKQGCLKSTLFEVNTVNNLSGLTSAHTFNKMFQKSINNYSNQLQNKQ